LKRLTVLGTTMATVGIAALTATARDRRPDENAKDVSRRCDVGTLRGKYGFDLSGLRPGVGGVPD
jgi:hypothetical protein